MAISTAVSFVAAAQRLPAIETSSSLWTKQVTSWNGLSYMQSLTDARVSRLSMSMKADKSVILSMLL